MNKIPKNFMKNSYLSEREWFPAMRVTNFGRCFEIPMNPASEIPRQYEMSTNLVKGKREKRREKGGRKEEGRRNEEVEGGKRKEEEGRRKEEEEKTHTQTREPR
jgi:hypothetical protein